MPSITAIVVNWNGPQLTSRAVESLLQRSGEPDAEIIIVDNGSEDDSLTVFAERFGAEPRVRVIPLPENLGFGGGVNAGIRASESPYVALLNNDAVIRDGWLHELRAVLEAPGNERVAAVTSRILLAGRWRELSPAELQEAAELGERILRQGRRHAVVRDDEHGTVRINSTGNIVDRSGNGADRDWLAPANIRAREEVFGFCGGAAMLRRAALDEVGLFDERLFMYYEDTDLSWRLRTAHWQIRYAERAVVEHEHAASSGTASEQFLRWNARNRILVAWRHGGLRMGMTAILRTNLRFFRALAGRRWPEVRAVWHALWDLVFPGHSH